MTDDRAHNQGDVVCLDTSVLIPFLVPEGSRPLREQIRTLVDGIPLRGRLIEPAWAWAEIGTVLRKKVRQGILLSSEADRAWAEFVQMRIEYVDMPDLRSRTWQIADRYALLTLYDAAFLACAEVAGAGAPTEFWTLDQQLLRSLGPARPAYVRELVEG